MSFTPSTLIPYLTVRNARQAVDFYQRAFGFVWLNADEVDASGQLNHAEMQYRDVIIMFATEGAFGEEATQAPITTGITMPLVLYVHCDDADTLYPHTLKQGAISLMEPWDSPWGARVFKVRDPEGFEWMFAQPLSQTA